jgi:flavin-binding protein dodecin
MAKRVSKAASKAASKSKSATKAKAAPKIGDEGVYKVVEVVGVSKQSWEDAARRAVSTAAKSIRDLRIAEVTKMDLKIDNGHAVAFRTRVSLSFKYED